VGILDRSAEPDDSDLGRRQRKKLETRRALVRAALELFSERGIDGTTVDDIASAVDVSSRTFHRYFAAKEDVLFADAEARRARFARFLGARPDDEPLLDALRAAAHDLTDSFLAQPTDERRRMRLILASDALRAQSLRHTDGLSHLVAEYAARRLSIGAGQPLPLLLAACTIAALRTARERWLEDPAIDYRAEIDQCFELVADLRGAIAAAPGSRRSGS
jgi:AcrR family transcriptional regulator